nr:MAG TPA: hypothetical protein [Caudoviricetes sp.]
MCEVRLPTEVAYHICVRYQIPHVYGRLQNTSKYV